jgi:AcrR family transcriptional regulator
MARGRAPGYDDQREMILAQAARLFAQRGYPATSMNQVAEACGLSKATLYHYYRDKYSLLLSIADSHVSRLQTVVDEVIAKAQPAEDRLRELIQCILEEYADAQDAHRVLTEDVRFLEPADRQLITDKERDVVEGFAQAIATLYPQLQAADLTKPVTMLLFGMINWLFTWMDPDGQLNYDTMSVIVSDLFLGGLGAIKPPGSRRRPTPK